MATDEWWLLFLLDGALGRHQCRGRLALAKKKALRIMGDYRHVQSILEKTYIDANSNVPSEMTFPVRNRSHSTGATLPVAIPRDLRIAAEEGDLLQEFCELLM